MTALRIDWLSLERYGAFTERTVPLGPGLTVVAGANEAGKSTLLDALADLLWGIPHVSTRSFLYARPALAVAAHLRLPGGGSDRLEVSVDVVRRGSGLCRRDTGEAVEAFWHRPGDDRGRWRQSFGLSHETLRAGGRDLLEGSGDLAQLVFTARSGTRVQEVRAALQRTADSLYKEHRGNRSVAVRTAMADYERARAQVEVASASADAVRAARDVLARAQAAATAAARRAAAAAELLALAQRRRQAAPRAQELAQVLARAEAVRRLGPSADAEQVAAADAARERAALAARASETLEASLARWRGEASTIVVDEALLADAPTLAALHRDAAVRVRDAEEAAGHAAAADALLADAAAALATITPGVHEAASSPVDAQARLAALARLREALSGVAVGDDLARQLDALAEELTSAQGDLAAARRALDAAQVRLAAAEPARADVDAAGVAAVAEALAAIGAAGSATAAQVAAAAEHADAVRRREENLAAAALPAQTSWAPPDLAAVRTHLAARRAATSADAAAAERLADAAGLLAGAREQLEAASALDVPDAGALAALRGQRDTAMQALVAAWAAGEPASVGGALVLTLAQASARADDLADTLVSRAAAVARRDELARACSEREGAHAEAAERAVTARRAAAAAEQAWQELWRGRSEAPHDEEGALAVHRCAELARQAHAQALAAAASVELLAPRVRAQRSALAAALAAAGRPRPDADLESLTAAATALLADADAARESRAARAELTRQHAVAQREVLRAQATVDDALARWRDLGRRIGLPAALEAIGWSHRRGVVANVAELLAQAEEACDDAAVAGGRAAAFATAAGEVALRHVGGEDAAPADVRQAAAVVGVLVERLDQAQAAAAEAARLRERVGEAATTLADHQGVRRAAQEELDALGDALGLHDPDELVEAVERGRVLAVAQVEAARLDELVRAADPSADVTALAADLAGVEVGELEAQEQLAAAERDDAEVELEAARDALAEARQRERILASGQGAAELHARATEHLAEVGERVERYLVARFQLEVLREQLESYERQHTSPLLDVAGQLLEQLTGGRYVALDVADAAAGRGLVVVDADEQRLGPEALSEGTRDQVFLALRLAGIDSLQSEREAAGAPLLPVVFDDVLMTFDDVRAEAALRVMAALALRWQVVVLTHHTHLADLADQLMDQPPARPSDEPAAASGASPASRHIATTRLAAPEPLAMARTPDQVRVRARAHDRGVGVTGQGRDRQGPAGLTDVQEKARA